MADRSKFLVDVEWLSNHLKADNIVIVDCQWDTNAYIRAHIPGAIMRPGHPYVKSQVNGEPAKYLPTEKEFQGIAQNLGIDADSTVVCYDEWDNHFATRFWWVLNYYGHTNVKLLDGGWQAWVSGRMPRTSISPPISGTALFPNPGRYGPIPGSVCCTMTGPSSITMDRRSCAPT